MKSETTYNSRDFESGICSCCEEQSDEILIGDGRCIECIEDEKFYNQCMKGV